MRNFVNKKAMNVKSDRFLPKKKEVTSTNIITEIEPTVVEPTVVEPTIVEPIVLETEENIEETKKETKRKNSKKNKENNDIE